MNLEAWELPEKFPGDELNSIGDSGKPLKIPRFDKRTQENALYELEKGHLTAYGR